MRKEIRDMLMTEVVTSSEAMASLKLKGSTVRQRARRKTLESVKKGSVLLYDRLDVEPEAPDGS